MYKEIMDLLLDENDRTVGGGAASALSGAMAAGMAAMVASLSAEKPVNLSVEEYESIVKELTTLRQNLLEGANKDRAAFLEIKEAFALPKETDEEKAARRKSIGDAAYHAACVPRDNGVYDRRVYDLVCHLEGNSNPACLSDLLSAKSLSSTGVLGCAMNIDANLPLIKDEEREAALLDDKKEMLTGLDFCWLQESI